MRNAVLHVRRKKHGRRAARAAVDPELGELSPEKGKIIREAMAKARQADQAGDKAACAQALQEVERAIGP